MHKQNSYKEFNSTFPIGRENWSGNKTSTIKRRGITAPSDSLQYEHNTFSWVFVVSSSYE